MKANNYFSWENIGEMADIDTHIKYASTLLNKYKWKKSSKQKLEKQLAAIVDKQNDKMLNICVIGEFSTGKSSFINALVGYELLAVNVIQGTTVAITIIEYSDEFSITLTDFEGNSKKMSYKSINSLRQQLHHYTTDSAYAKKVSYVTVTLPSDILKNGYRIIDTPGTNSLELWHEDITRRAIQDLSDLSIVLTDATQPMPTSLVSFVDNTLGETIKSCAFVANKIDRIRERERSGIVKFIDKKITQSFEIDEPLVLPFSAVALTNAFAKETVGVDSDSFLLTTNSLERLLSYTAKQRIKAQARKILHLIDGVYTTLNSDIKKISDHYHKELELLERTKQTDLKPFIAKQVSTRQTDFMLSAKDFKYKIETACESLISNSINSVNSKIDNYSNLTDLSNYIKNGGLSADIKNEGQSIISGAEAKYGGLRRLFKNELMMFQKEFEQEFDKLKILSIKFNVKPKDVAVRHSAHSANIGPVVTLISEELSKENWAMGGGAAAGAVIGTAILPGVGTVLGGLIGLFAGGAAAPDIYEVRNKVKSKLSVPVQLYYKSVANDCITNYNNYVSDVNKYLESEINKYYSTYASTVNQRIQEWNIQHREVKEKIAMVENEIDGIVKRQQSIKTIITQI